MSRVCHSDAVTFCEADLSSNAYFEVEGQRRYCPPDGLNRQKKKKEWDSVDETFAESSTSKTNVQYVRTKRHLARFSFYTIRSHYNTQL